MKNFKWHKLGLVAFSIWMINSLVEIKLGSFRPLFYVMIAFIIMLASMSCSSSRHTLNKTKQKTDKMVTPHKQYAFVNNQIIMFENN